MAAIGTLFRFLISFAIIGIIIWLVIYPEPLKPIIHQFYPHNEYDPNENAQINGDITLYSNPDSEHKSLIVIFIGGGSLFSVPHGTYGLANRLNELLGNKFDILLFAYPTRFKYTIHQTMEYINDVLSKYVHYPSIHALGISFGCILAGAFYHKEHSKQRSKAMKLKQIGITFKSFASFCGTLDRKFNAEILNYLFDWYILRNTPGKSHYTCFGMQIPTYLVSSNTDFLIAQSIRFINTQMCTSKIFTNKNLPHAFCQYHNLPETKEAIEEYAKFVIEHDKHTQFAPKL